MLRPTLQYALSILAYRKVFLTAGFLHFYPVKTTLYLNVYKEKYFSKEYFEQKRLYFNLPDNAGGGGTTTAMHFFSFFSRWRIPNKKTGKFRTDFLFTNQSFYLGILTKKNTRYLIFTSSCFLNRQYLTFYQNITSFESFVFLHILNMCLYLHIAGYLRIK